VNEIGNVTYPRDSGDGEISDNPASDIYKSQGNYTCKLEVIDEKARRAPNQVNINVTKNQPPIMEILVDKTSGYRLTEIDFDANCFDVDGRIVSYKWSILYSPLLGYQKVVNYNKKKAHLFDSSER